MRGKERLSEERKDGRKEKNGMLEKIEESTEPAFVQFQINITLPVREFSYFVLRYKVLFFNK